MKLLAYFCKKGGSFWNGAWSHISEASSLGNQVTTNNSFRLIFK